MKIIRNKKNQIVIGVTDHYLYYLTSELESIKDEEQISFFKENANSLSINLIKDNCYRLITILNLQIEYENIDEVEYKYIIEEIKNYSNEWKEIIQGINFSPFEIILLEDSSSSMFSSTNDKLYISKEKNSFNLTSCREPNLSAYEIIEYFGLDHGYFWDVTLDSGEMIVFNSEDIENAQDLNENIKYILTNEEQWDIPEDKIDWTTIIEVLIKNDETESIGKELQIIKKR